MQLSHPVLSTLIFTQGKRIDGTMYFLVLLFGVKIGEVFGTAVVDGCLSSVDISEQMQLSRSLHLI